MMKIAVISNGPSAKLYDESQQFDLTIGVNKSVRVFRCDWWCLYDTNTFIAIEPIGTPRLAVCHHVPGKIERQHQEAFERFKRSPEILIFDRDIKIPNWTSQEKWCCYSGLAALGVAYYLATWGRKDEAHEIVVFGADMSGDDDCCNETNGTRTETRWQKERRLFQMLVECLAKENVAVHR